ncbi:MAG: hypothetical protein ACI9H6_000373 [Patiriisocius sp.]|jgi:hypothetical protein
MSASLKTIIPLALVFSLLVATNFIYAAWTAPSGVPSEATNAPAPINVSAEFQDKAGDLTIGGSLGVFGGFLYADTEVRSPRYCDEVGGNCFSATTSAAVGDTVIGMITVETSGYTMNAHEECLLAGYDGVWGFADRSGPEEVLCFSSPTIVVSLPIDNWVQKTGSSCTATCSALGKTLTPDPDYNNAVCASGEQQVTSSNVSYIYGTWSTAQANQTSEVGAYCYNPGRKRDSDGTDLTVGCNCS